MHEMYGGMKEVPDDKVRSRRAEKGNRTLGDYPIAANVMARSPAMKQSQFPAWESASLRSQ